jgi:putative transposase
MPRTARLDAPDLLQHVIFRGVDRCAIFRDDGDREQFLARLSRLLVGTDTECLAWALLTNHVHLLLRPRQTRLAFLMRRLLTGYALYFNRRHQRSGHLFQNRYKSIACEEDAYLLELVRYIHLNPQRAGLVTDLAALDTYPWCGHGVLMGKSVLAGQVTSEVLAFFARKQGEARRRYRLFMADGVAQGRRDDLTSSGRRSISLPDGAYDDRILGGVDFIERLRARRELAPTLSTNIGIGELISRVCNHFALDPGTLRQRTRAPKVADVRGIVCCLAVRHLGLNGVEVGRHLGLSRSGVSIAAGRGEQLLKSDPALLDLVN